MYDYLFQTLKRYHKIIYVAKLIIFLKLLYIVCKDIDKINSSIHTNDGLLLNRKIT